MKLKYVTLTGADDTVKQEQLIALSKRYPFVEWAILFSQSKSGVSRYPSHDWADQLVSSTNLGCNFSAHLCGKWVDDVMAGEVTFFRDEKYDDFFQRYQLNMGESRLKSALESLKVINAVDRVNKPVIFGGNYEGIDANTTLTTMMFHRQIFPLFDASGGKGIKAKTWPKPFVSEYDTPLFCGYAGGLKPETLAEELKKIEDVVGDECIWIDMESGLRTKSGKKDIFDLEKCEQVLQVAEAWAG